MTDKEMYSFVDESNKIEGINRKPTQIELAEFKRLLELKEITVDDIIKFVSIYDPEASLRDDYGLDIRVGNYLPPWGGPHIRERLIQILESGLPAWQMHILYQKVQPFTDGNGRSARALWAWKQRDISKGFLNTFYFQTLDNTHYTSYSSRETTILKERN